MIVYRYEMPDGGGPFCTREGQVRTNSGIQFDDDTLYCCQSVDKLKKWFTLRGIDTTSFSLTKYEGEEISENEREIIIRKSTARKIL